jgi:hypothetical protein
VRDFSVIVTAFVMGALAGAGSQSIWQPLALARGRFARTRRTGVPDAPDKKNLPSQLPLSSVEASGKEEKLSCSDTH